MKRLILLFPLFLAVASAHAEEGPGSGNGGNLVRIDVESVISQIAGNCDKWSSIRFVEKDDKKVCDLIRDKIKDVATVKSRLRILPSLKSDRTGENFPEIPEVHFSESKWTANKDNTIAKIGIVLHEFLGLVGLEHTDEYTISKAVMKELQAVSLVSSDNPNFMSTMTKVAGLISKARSCGNKLTHQERMDLIENARNKMRSLYGRKDITPQEKKVIKEKWDAVTAFSEELILDGLYWGGESLPTFCHGKATKKTRKAEIPSASDEESSTQPAN